MGTVRQMKKGKAKPSPLSPALMEAWHRGFEQGVKEQLTKDIESTVTLLVGLESIPGIGEKTAFKIREHVMNKFGQQGG